MFSSFIYPNKVTKKNANSKYIPIIRDFILL